MSILEPIFQVFRDYPFLGPILGAIVGVILKAVYDYYKETRKFKRELEDNNNIIVTGTDWFAAWQTCVDGIEIINTEKLTMEQIGQTVKIKNKEKSPENPKGGYLWEAQMQFFQGRHLMGWYFPLKEENNNSKGIMFFAYFSQKKIFYGKWTGAAYDGDLVSGFVVIGKDKEEAVKALKTLKGKTQGDAINIIYNAFPSVASNNERQINN